MANPLSQLNPANAYDISGANALYRAFAESKNPMEAFGKIASQNPKLKGVMDAFRQGQTPQGVFRSMCNQRGINPDEFIRRLTKR